MAECVHGPVTSGGSSMDSQEAKQGEAEVSICCPGCKALKAVPLSKFKGLEKTYLAKCGCGHTFNLFFEKRRSIRKNTVLDGSCAVKSSMQDFPIQVVDLSNSGLCFVKRDYAQVKKDDEVIIKFTLDTPHRPVITCQGRVRNVKKDRVGVELTSVDGNKRDFGFYLM